MLSLELIDNGTAHNDLMLRCGEVSSRADSYYFALTRDTDNSVAVTDCLVSIWRQWLQALERAASECFIPIGLFDQSSSWLQSVVEQGRATVEFGWSTRPGHDIALAITDVPPDDFDAVRGSHCEFSVAALKHTIHQVISNLNEAAMQSSTGTPTMNETDSAPEKTIHTEQAITATDPTPIFEHFRGAYGTQLLTAAVSHFRIFELLQEPLPVNELQAKVKLADRPMTVLLTALKAMGLIAVGADGMLCNTPLAAEHLSHAGAATINNYIGLAATAPDVQLMIERLTSNQPFGVQSEEDGAAFIYRDGVPSAMDDTELARHFTLSLAGRAKYVAPVLAKCLSLHQARTLVDVGGGSGIYAIELLKSCPELQAVIMDRSEVLSVAQEFAEEAGVADRCRLLPADMFTDPIPEADVILLSNILHDWDVPECQTLISRAAASLAPFGQLLVHDVFLNDDLSGPLPIALYSAALFSLTEGRAYSVAEYRSWLEAAGLQVSGPHPTAIHCGVLIGQAS